MTFWRRSLEADAQRQAERHLQLQQQIARLERRVAARLKKEREGRKLYEVQVADAIARMQASVAGLEQATAAMSLQMVSQTADVVHRIDERIGDAGHQINALEQRLDALSPIADRSAAATEHLVPAVENLLGAIKKSAARSKQTTRTVAKIVDSLTGQLKRIQSRLLGVSGAFGDAADEQFLQVAQAMRESRRTMLDYDRLFTLWQAAANVASRQLPVVEIGSYRGGSAAVIVESLRAAGAVAPELHVVDTFEGHIETSFTVHDVEAQRGKFRETNYEEVREFLGAYGGVYVHQGDAGSVIRGWPERQYGLVHIDVDFYGPTRECLDYFGPRVATGGVLVMDDYGSPTCPGVVTAVREFLAVSPGFQAWKLLAEQLLIVRVGP